MDIRHMYDGKKWDKGTDAGKEPSRTKQAFKSECDVNEILKRYQKTGLPPDMRQGGRYGDFSSVPQYQDALHIVARAQETFQAFPAKTRSEFQNDPAAFLAFCQDPKNADDLVRLGLAVAKTPPKGGSEEPKATSGASDEKGQTSSGSVPVAGTK